MFVLDPSAKEMWLEVHKLPKENWINELDTIIQAIKKKEEKKDEQTISEMVTIQDCFISKCPYVSNLFFICVSLVLID